MSVYFRTNNVNIETSESPSVIQISANKEESTSVEIKVKVTGYVEIVDSEIGHLQYILVSNLTVEDTTLSGWNSSMVKVENKQSQVQPSGGDLNITFTQDVYPRSSQEPVKADSSNASSVGSNPPQVTELGSQYLRFNLDASYDSDYYGKFSDTLDLALSPITVEQKPAEIEIEAEMPPGDASVTSPGSVTVNEDGSVTIQQPQVNTSGIASTLPAKGDSAKTQCIEIDALGGLFSSLGPIVLPEWLVLNLVALETNWYVQVTYIPAELVSITTELASFAAVYTKASVEYALNKEICVNQGKANYDRVMNGGDKYIIRLEDFTEYMDYSLVDGDVVEVPIKTRVIYGEPSNPILYLAQKSFKKTIFNLIDMVEKMTLLTSKTSFAGVNFYGGVIKKLLSYLKFVDGSYKFVWDDPEEFEFMKWIYYDQSFVRKLTKRLQEVNANIELNKVLEENSISSYDDYISQFEWTDPNTGRVYSDGFRRLEKFTWAATDVIKGSTPFTLKESEIFVHEYYTKSRAIDMINDLIHGIVKAIERIPKDIQDLATSIMEPQGAVVVTPMGAGAVVTNPLQIFGGLFRTKTALSQLKNDIGIPLNLLKSFNMPTEFLLPLQVVYDILDSIV